MWAVMLRPQRAAPYPRSVRPRAPELGHHEPADELVGADRALRGSPVALGAITGKIAGRPAAPAFLSREPAFVRARVLVAKLGAGWALPFRCSGCSVCLPR
jgi:hypothetical protein